MALFSTVLLSNNDSSLLFSYRFPTLAIGQQVQKPLEIQGDMKIQNKPETRAC